MQWRKLIQRIQDDYQWVIFSSAGQKIWELIKHSLGRLKLKKKNYDKNGINAIRNEILLRISPALTREGQSKHFPGSNFTNWY